jgi:hypothetical protein
MRFSLFWDVIQHFEMACQSHLEVQASLFWDCLNLEDGTDKPSQNTINLPSLNTA